MTQKIPLANFQPIIYLLPPNIRDHQSWLVDWLLKQRCCLHNALNDSHIYWVNREFQNLNIEMVRKLAIEMSYASFGSGCRYVIVLNLNQATLEAQNALLKTLEEPPAQTQFIITTQQLNTVLPTVLSRSWVEKISSSTDKNSLATSQASDFHFVSFGQAITQAEKFKDRQVAETQLQAWLLSLTENHREKNWPKIKLIQKALSQLQKNGNVRLVLENCFFQTLTLAAAL